MSVISGVGFRVGHTRTVIPRSEVIQLNASPQPLVEGEPGVVFILQGVVVHKPAGAAAYAISSASTFEFSYSHGASAVVAGMGTAKVTDASERVAAIVPYSDASGDSSHLNPQGTGFTIQLGGSVELTGGDDDQPFIVDVFYLSQSLN